MFRTVLQMIAVIVWLLPVPGGPSTVMYLQVLEQRHQDLTLFAVQRNGAFANEAVRHAEGVPFLFHFAGDRIGITMNEIVDQPLEGLSDGRVRATLSSCRICS